MARRSEPNRAELLTVMRLLADVSACGADPAGQHRLLIEGLARLFDASLAWLLVLDGARVDRPLRPVAAAMPADTDPFWLQYAATFATHVPASADPFARHILPCRDADQHWTRRRVLPDAAALRAHPAAADLIDSARVGDGAVAALRVAGGADRIISLSLHRTRSDPAMTARDHALQRFAAAEVRRLVERKHLRVDPQAKAAADAYATEPLPPKARDVLRRLLSGSAPKTIARDLGLSVWTVRDHVKWLHAHYGVASRGELMARFIGDD